MSDPPDPLELPDIPGATIEYNELYALVAQHRHRAASDLVFDWFEDRFDEGRWTECNETLAMLDPSKISSTVAVAILAVTGQAKEHLSGRDEFFEKVRRHLSVSMGEAEAMDLLGERR